MESPHNDGNSVVVVCSHNIWDAYYRKFSARSYDRYYHISPSSDRSKVEGFSDIQKIILHGDMRELHPEVSERLMFLAKVHMATVVEERVL
jgi:hypothetical protein